MAAATTQQGPQQAGRAADRGAGAVPGVLRDARQERADRGAQFPDRGVEPVEFLPGQEHPAHLAPSSPANRPSSIWPAQPIRRRRRRSQKQVDEWTKTAARYRSEPEAAGGKGEGTVELSRRALEEQHQRDEYLAKYHHYEFASAAFQIGIVLASATVITGMVVLSLPSRRPRRDRPRLHGDWAVRAARRASALTGRGGSACRAHAAADAPQQPQGASGPLRPEDAEHSLDPPLDRRDQMMRPVEPRQHVLVEPAEPAELQKLGLASPRTRRR